MTSDRVLTPVSAGLGTSVSRGEVAVTSRADSAVFTVSASTPDPVRSVDVANAVAQRFAEVVGELERPGGPGAPPTVAGSVVNRAQPPAVPAGPGTASNLLVGLFVGSMAALVAVLARAVGDTSVRTATALRTVVGGAALGAFPGRSGRRRTDGYDNAAREIRTRLRLATTEEPVSVLALASTGATEGTTGALCALAEAFARNAQVLVVDADLRQPGVATRLGAGDGPGLTDVLSGRRAAEDVIRRTGRFDLLPAGPPDEDPGELLSSPALRELFDVARERYDVVLVDTPAVESTADGVVVARQVDGVVVVCRAGRTTEPQLRTAVDALHEVGARIIGSVLTTGRVDRAPAVSPSASGSFTRRGDGSDAPPEIDHETVTVTQTPSSRA